MKKTVFLFAIIIISLPVFAQSYKKGGSNNGSSFSVGITGMAKNTWLLNKNVFDDTNASQEVEASFGSAFGLSMGIYFNEIVGIGIEALYSSHNQKYNGDIVPGTQNFYRSKFHINSIDVPLYLRLSTSSGAYFEFGSYFCFVTASRFTSDSKVPLVFPAEYDAKAVTSSFYIAPMLGFGLDINLSDYLILTPGLRFAYGVTDLKGVDGRGNPIQNYPQPEKTNALSGGLNLSLVYRIDL